MNFLLDRFPIKTFNDLKVALEDLGHKIPLSVLKKKISSEDKNLNVNYFVDRDIARGVVIKDIPMILNRQEIEQASKYEGLVINTFSRFDTSQGNFSSPGDVESLL